MEDGKMGKVYNEIASTFIFKRNCLLFIERANEGGGGGGKNNNIIISRETLLR